ncbi:hypothetical protein GCM10020219_057030 [Nonomuraea dietziae]
MSDESSAARAAWERVDTTIPHSARVWDFLLGGKDHYAVDREVGETLLTLFPDFRDGRPAPARVPHARCPVPGERGGSAPVPGYRHRPATANNTHEVAQSIAPETRVVYVDTTPIVLVHARALLTSAEPGVTDYIDADVRHPDVILTERPRLSTSPSPSP